MEYFLYLLMVISTHLKDSFPYFLFYFHCWRSIEGRRIVWSVTMETVQLQGAVVILKFRRGKFRKIIKFNQRCFMFDLLRVMGNDMNLGRVCCWMARTNFGGLLHRLFRQFTFSGLFRPRVAVPYRCDLSTDDLYLCWENQSQGRLLMCFTSLKCVSSFKCPLENINSSDW